MFGVAVVVVVVFFSGVITTFAEPSTPLDPKTLKRAYVAGIDFKSFLKNVDKRNMLAQLSNPWNANWRKSGPSDEQISRARSLRGNYRLLAIAAESCSDSVHTIPYLARLADRIDRLEMHMLSPKSSKVILENYSAGGHMVTPTVLILNENFEVVGTWNERPLPLKDWLTYDSAVRDHEMARRKQFWYMWDEGHHTRNEILNLLEAADANSGR
jgi:hypothetical protein